MLSCFHYHIHMISSECNNLTLQVWNYLNIN
nr:MAG TPA: hypothetical protein [Caudoviricetes sp.]DAR19050.1 MAG TPA: hypothetical protein [Caudoviricetes sp.]